MYDKLDILVPNKDTVKIWNDKSEFVVFKDTKMYLLYSTMVSHKVFIPNKDAVFFVDINDVDFKIEYKAGDFIVIDTGSLLKSHALKTDHYNEIIGIITEGKSDYDIWDCSFKTLDGLGYHVKYDNIVRTLDCNNKEFKVGNSEYQFITKKIPKPKFKFGDKIKFDNEKEFMIVMSHKKDTDGFRYTIMYQKGDIIKQLNNVKEDDLRMFDVE